MKVKNSAIIYTAYDYQTLQGVNLLAQWLHSPTKYSRVAFEADKDANETPMGIDDIVCERPDGVKDFWQVKFTPSPHKDENRLTWDWLLKVSGKSENSRSILKKLYDAVISVPPERLGEVVLLTNKLPDRDMESCLFDSQIKIDQINDNVKSEIIRQLGNSVAAEFFFSKVTIQHSDRDYHTINRNLRENLLKFSDYAGVERLIARAREWAMFKDSPPGGGWIQLFHIREVLSPRRPEPIPEMFSVPDDYCLPNLDFHNEMLERIIASEGEVITLTGKPGGGKSTYLSFLCKELESNEIPLVRHHYFLSLSDSTVDRLSPRIVAESLLHQISKRYNDAGANTSQPENLCEAIATCANYYKTKEKPFVVLIDGLDHVWRDNAKDKKPLEELFKQLLPAKENVVVLIGTQSVDNALLPNVLLSTSPKREWRWLPEMSGNSIYEYLKLHVDSSRLMLNCHADHVDEEVQGSANALVEITNGYPLHVIYSLEFLSVRGLPLSRWQIEQLPPCGDGSILTYYNEMWNSLNYKQKDVLHLTCGLQFAWPRQAIGQVVKDDHDNAPSVNAVAHLLSETISGVRPFHESLVVFVRNQENHQSCMSILLPHVCEWLGSEAPLHLKENWLWSSQARIGDASMLRQGVTRDWVLDRLIVGMPVKACIRLLSEAEMYAFEDRNYAEAYRHRELKTRLLNGPEFQTWDFASLDMLSIVAADDYALNEVLSRENEYSPIKLSTLAMAMWFRGETDRAKILSKKAIDRYRTKTKLLASKHVQDEENEAFILIKAGTLTDSLNYDVIFAEDSFSNWPDVCISSFRSACLIKKEINMIMRGWKSLTNDSPNIQLIELDAIRLSILEDADIRSRHEYKQFSSQKLSKFLDVYSEHAFNDIAVEHVVEVIETGSKVAVTESYHSWFFSSLCIRLYAQGNFTWLPINAEVDRVDVSFHYNLLNELADIVACELMAGNELTFERVCLLFPDEMLPSDIEWEKHRSVTNLKRQWIGIAADCHLITTKSKISFEMLKNVLDSNVFISDWVRLWYKELKLELLTEDAVKLLIESEMCRLSSELEETIEISTAYLELANIALEHDQQGFFQVCLRQAWDFVLGYGHHKDPTVTDILNAVEYLSTAAPESAISILERISPVVFNISKFTDGDGTRHAKKLISLLAAKLTPQTAASIYDQELKDGEWYYAEETIRELVERSDFSSPITKQLYLTGVPSSCYQVLRDKLEAGNAHAREIAFSVKAQFGLDIRGQKSEEYSTVNEADKSITLDPANYPPESLEKLSEDLREEISTHEFWKKWYNYWIDQGKENELLQELLPKIATITGRYDEKRYLLDLLYFSQRKMGGKTQAFKLLVQAQNAMNGWLDWYESREDTLKRLQIVAEQYPRKIDEFIKLTTIQQDSWKDSLGNLIVPHDKLVFLLSNGGRLHEAIQLVLSMIDGLEQSVRNLKLIKPDWDWRSDDSFDDALHKLLISRIKSPVPSIKLWVIEQIASLLSRNSPKIELLLKQDLASRKQESECVEVLCVFYIAHAKGYKCPQDLGRYIRARSVLSDLLLTKLIQDPAVFGEYALSFFPALSCDKSSHRFSYYQGSHVPLVYYSLLENEEKRTGIPFTKYYVNEWNNTFEYQPFSDTQIDYFLGSDRRRATGQFYTQASHRGRSAYLRTIELAKQFYGMPNSYAEQLSISALPIEPAYTGLVPQKPEWMPEWHNSTIADIESLTRFVEQALDNFKNSSNSADLLAFSLPIKIDENNWIDLSVVKAIANVESTQNLHIEERHDCFSIANLMDTELSYEFRESEKIDHYTLAATPYPLCRFGHWHSDMEARGLFVPKCNIEGKKIVGKTSNGTFTYYVDQLKIGFSLYWFTHWQPHHPKSIRSLCGSATLAYEDNFSFWLNKGESELTFVYICKGKILASEQNFGEFNELELSFVIK